MFPKLLSFCTQIIFLFLTLLDLCGRHLTQQLYIFSSKNGNLYKAGVEVGIDFTGKTTHFPNTLTGHQMMEYSKSLDSTMAIQNQVAEQIFQVSIVAATVDLNTVVSNSQIHVGIHSNENTE